MWFCWRWREVVENCWMTWSSVVFDNTRRIAVAGRGSENLRERLTMSKKTSKVEAARACKSTTESDCKERGACEKEDLYWCEAGGTISISWWVHKDVGVRTIAWGRWLRSPIVKFVIWVCSISTRLCLQQWCNSDEKETLRSTMKVDYDLQLGNEGWKKKSFSSQI